MWAGINLVTGWFLVYPLTKEEVKAQWLKRQAIGKFNYSLSMLDLELDKKEWAEEMERRRKIELGMEVPEKQGHH